MPVSPTEYEEWKGRQDKMAADKAAITLRDAEQSNPNPDRAAAMNTLAGFYRTKPENIGAEPNWFEGDLKERMQKQDLYQAPKLTQWLNENQTNAQLVHDDVNNLSIMERITSGFGQQFGQTALRDNPTTIADFTEGMAYLNNQPALLGVANGIRDNLVAAPPAVQQRAMMQLQNIKSAGDFAEWAAQSAGSTIASSLPSMMGAGAGFVAGGPFGAVAGAFGASYMQNYGDLYRELLDNGIFPKDAALYAAGATLPIAALDAYQPVMNVRRLAMGSTSAKSLAKRIAVGYFKGTLGEAIPEGVQEAIQIGTVSGATGKPFLTQENALRVLNVMGAAAVGGGVTAGATETAASFVDKVRAAKSSQQTIATLTALSKGASDTKSLQRVPEKFRDIVARATANGPIDEVYVSAKPMAEYFQSQGINPADVVAQFPGLTERDYNLAVASGGDIAIKTADYLTQFANSPHNQVLSQHMRFTPDQMTSAEGVAFEKMRPQLEAAIQAQMQGLEQDNQRTLQIDQTVQRTFAAQLVASGMRSPAAANTEAMFMAAYYQTRAERLGMTLEDYVNEHPIPLVEGVRPTPVAGQAAPATVAAPQAAPVAPTAAAAPTQVAAQAAAPAAAPAPAPVAADVVAPEKKWADLTTEEKAARNAQFDDENFARVKADEPGLTREEYDARKAGGMAMFKAMYAQSPIFAPPVATNEPLAAPGAWRDAVIKGETEDGQQHDVNAGDYVDLVQQRLSDALKLLECVNGG